MKTSLILTVPILSTLIVLSGCRTEQGPRHHQPGRTAVTAPPRNVAAPPYYHSNAEGRFYYSDDRVTNKDYRPTLRRNHAVRKKY